MNQKVEEQEKFRRLKRRKIEQTRFKQSKVKEYRKIEESKRVNRKKN